MFREDELREAIAECEGQRNPNANTCVKLASYYIILNQLFGNDPLPEPVKTDYIQSDYSYAYKSDSEFMGVIDNLDMNYVLQVVDELMETLKNVQPRLYNAVIRKLNQ